MFEDFLSDYSKKLSGYGLVFKYMKWNYYLFRFSIVPFSILMIFFIFSIILQKYLILSGFALLLSFIFIILMFYKFNAAAKKVILIRYGINPSTFLWSNNDYFEFSKRELKEYLNGKGWLNNEKLQILVSLLYKEAELRKFPNLLIPGLLLGFSIPVWDKVLDYIYKSVANKNVLIVITSLLIIIILFVVIMIGIIKHPLEEMKDDLISRDSQNMKHIARRLEHLLLEIPSS